MALILCAAMATAIVGACVAPIYYFKETAKSAENDDFVGPRIVVNKHDPTDSPRVHVQINHRRQHREILEAVSPRIREVLEAKDDGQGCCCGESRDVDDKPEDSKKAQSLRADVCPQPRLSADNVEENPSKDRPSRLQSLLPWKKHRRASKTTDNNNNNGCSITLDPPKGITTIKIPTPAGKDNPSVCSTSPSSAATICGAPSVVTAEIHVPPQHCVSSFPNPASTQKSQQTRLAPSRVQEKDSFRKSANPKASTIGKSTPLTQILLDKFKNFTKTLHRNRAENTSTIKDIAGVRLNCQTPVGHSTVLPKRRVLDENVGKPVMSPDTRSLKACQTGTVSEKKDEHNVAFHDVDADHANRADSSDGVMKKLFKGLPFKFDRSGVSSSFRIRRRSPSQSVDNGHKVRTNVDSGIAYDTSDATRYVDFSQTKGKLPRGRVSSEHRIKMHKKHIFF